MCPAAGQSDLDAIRPCDGPMNMDNNNCCCCCSGCSRRQSQSSPKTVKAPMHILYMQICAHTLHTHIKRLTHHDYGNGHRAV